MTIAAAVENLTLPKFSIGVGDRFAHQAKAQLAACLKAQEAGVLVAPVWNKSNREHSDFFTLDVADMIGKAAKPEAVKAFVEAHPELVGTVTIPGIAAPFQTDKAFVEGVANKFLAAVQNAGEIYRFILENKGAGRFVPEISM